MVQKKQDKYDILADAMRALRDENKNVVIETLEAKNIGYNSWVFDGDKPFIPVKPGQVSDSKFANVHYAKSLKIGPDVSIKRVHRVPTRVKSGAREYDVSNGFYYVVRTPLGEAKFDNTDYDFMQVWGFALAKYLNPKKYRYTGYAFKNKQVHKAYAAPRVDKNENKSKFDLAMENLKNLGVRIGRKFGMMSDVKQRD
ncbi:MAG: hypothetical protein II208_03855 [Alphaproteobacteria bacterium]|nr:hypothetical protein [Alphaproteobacteria bacterium]